MNLAKFTGGELIVRHGQGEGIERELVFDWSQSTESPTIYWTASHIDCNLEMQEVIAGHCIVLRYDMFVTRAKDNLAGRSQILHPTQLPLYKMLSKALESPSFLEGGRLLGYYLKHEYQHNGVPRTPFLPEILKGIDMILYEVASALKLKSYLRPLHEFDPSLDGLDYPPAYKLFGSGFRDSGDAGCRQNQDEEEEAMDNFMCVLDDWEEDKVIWLNDRRNGTVILQAFVPRDVSTFTLMCF